MSPASLTRTRHGERETERERERDRDKKKTHHTTTAHASYVWMRPAFRGRHTLSCLKTEHDDKAGTHFLASILSSDDKAGTLLLGCFACRAKDGISLMPFIRQANELSASVVNVVRKTDHPFFGKANLHSRQARDRRRKS